VFLINSRRPFFLNAYSKAPLIPKLQGKFAEFLQLHSSIVSVYSTYPLVSDLIRSAEAYTTYLAQARYTIALV